jgi:two-component sensor histidine kinase
MKYGALSVPEGNIFITWRTERNPDSGVRLFITWRERGGPQISTAGQRGFGSTLIEKSIAGANVENMFEPQGLTCKIDFTFKPLKRMRLKQRLKVRR